MIRRAGIAARFVTLVTKRAVVTKRAATDVTQTEQIGCTSGGVYVPCIYSHVR